MRLNGVSSVLAVTFVGIFWYVFKKVQDFYCPRLNIKPSIRKACKAESPKDLLHIGETNSGIILRLNVRV
jgi:hypothetical protein